MRERIFLDRIKDLVSLYTTSQPFALTLNSYFRNHPQMGARDRRQTRDFCFAYYRLGKALPKYDFSERLAIASFLCIDGENSQRDFMLNEFAVKLAGKTSMSIDEKLKLVENLYPDFKLSDVFPSVGRMSNGIDEYEFLKSFFIQPLLWIRIRKKFIAQVNDDLAGKGIIIEEKAGETCLGLKSGQKIDDLRTYKKGYFEIQDRSSQSMQSFYRPLPKSYWCDACAASGGKSLMLLEEQSDLNILAVDVRPNILFNYKERLNKVGWKNFKTLTHDLSSKGMDEKFAGVIADVPCTGSGTWSRSPEHLTLSPDEGYLDKFVKLQRRIVANLVASLPAGAPLIYSTCSSYSAENEGNVLFFEQNLPLKAEESMIIPGFRQKADTMFISRMIKV